MNDRERAGDFLLCRRIARREAKNFYYGFQALPRRKSDAMCAIYAFMRRADDISDDESLPVPERRSRLAAWLRSFHSGEEFEGETAAVFRAVRAVQRVYSITDVLLDDLVAGTAMDLAAARPTGVVGLEVNGLFYDVYDTVETLDSYCYLVASVVGLATIRIFGYQNPAAETHAVALGKAFQYTNILRDVKEDVERRRIYLPCQLLAAHGASPDQVIRAAHGVTAEPELIAALEALSRLAEAHYTSAEHLIPLLDADSRPAMRILVDIYAGLLRRIRATRFQVFGERIRLSSARKISILASGLLRGRLSGAR